jgi:hypothetical protein
MWGHILKIFTKKLDRKARLWYIIEGGGITDMLELVRCMKRVGSMSLFSIWFFDSKVGKDITKDRPLKN